jgi:hypothetical protein
MNMIKKISIASASLCLICPAILFLNASAVPQKEKPALVDTPEFNVVTQRALSHRAKRMLDSEAFLKMMKKDEVLLLDTRSKAAYDKKHLKGAVHLNFSDFTKGSLADVIPAKKTTILIYCNNNIAGNKQPFRIKKAALALNIPTFINLFGYGYENVYELQALVAIDDERFQFEGSGPRIQALNSNR